MSPTGAFTVSSPYIWDLSKLYTTGEVTFSPLPALPGDFNDNGIVDAADYVVWRKTRRHTDRLQHVAGQLRRNPAGSGSALPSAERSPTVPEPATLVLLMFAAAGWCLRRRRAA